jgi:hypothetical protein
MVHCVWNSTSPYITPVFNFVETTVKESAACITSFLPEITHIKSSHYGKYCANSTYSFAEKTVNAANNIAEKSSPLTDSLISPIRSLFTTVWNIQAFPKLPADIAKEPSSNSFGAVTLLTTSLLLSLSASMMTYASKAPFLQNRVQVLNNQKFLAISSLLFSTLKGLTLGIGTSLSFGLDPIVGGSIGATSMALMDGISHYTSGLIYGGSALLQTIGVLNFGQVLYQEFTEHERDFNTFFGSLSIGSSNQRIQSEINEYKAFGWQIFGLSYLPYSATAYLSSAIQSPSWRNNTWEMLYSTPQKAYVTLQNRTMEFAKSPSIDSLHICSDLKSIAPKSFSYVPKWCMNSYTFMGNMKTELTPLWNSTMTYLQNMQATNKTNT